MIIPIFKFGGVDLVNIRDILYISADGNYCVFHLSNGRNITSVNVLGYYERKFYKFPLFVRIHYSYIVNLYHVSSYQKGDGGYVTLKDGKELPVSRSKRDTLFHSFENLFQNQLLINQSLEDDSQTIKKGD